MVYIVKNIAKITEFPVTTIEKVVRDCDFCQRIKNNHKSLCREIQYFTLRTDGKEVWLRIYANQSNIKIRPVIS
jgi:hypothetical protein